jgi:hypothetical protein
MKTKTICLLIISIMISGIMISGCTKEKAQSPLPASMKGYELYAWKTGDDWYFTLIMGTNRQKTLEEITYKEDILDEEGFVKINVIGVDAIKKTLKRLPRNESVYFLSIPGTKLIKPPEDVLKDIKAQCNKSGIECYY